MPTLTTDMTPGATCDCSCGATRSECDATEALGCSGVSLPHRIYITLTSGSGCHDMATLAMDAVLNGDGTISHWHGAAGGSSATLNCNGLLFFSYTGGDSNTCSSGVMSVNGGPSAILKEDHSAAAVPECGPPFYIHGDIFAFASAWGCCGNEYVHIEITE